MKINGRPARTLNDEQIAQLPGLAAVLSVDQLADFYMMAKPTLYVIFKKNPHLFELYKSGKARAIASIGTNLIKMAKKNPSAAMFYLKTQAGWRETDHISEEKREAIFINIKNAEDLVIK